MRVLPGYVGTAGLCRGEENVNRFAGRRKADRNRFTFAEFSLGE